MINKTKLVAIATAMGLAMIIALLSSPVRADVNPFSVSDTSSALVVAGEEGKCEEGKCEEGKCDDGKAAGEASEEGASEEGASE